MLNKVLLLSFLTLTDSKLRKCSSDEVDSKSWRVKGKFNVNKDCSTLNRTNICANVLVKMVY